MNADPYTASVYADGSSLAATRTGFTNLEKAKRAVRDQVGDGIGAWGLVVKGGTRKMTVPTRPGKPDWTVEFGHVVYEFPARRRRRQRL